MTTGMRAQLLDEFDEDSDYRHGYMEAFTDSWIATQIRVLREQRGWTQQDLAQRTGMRQSTIARLESTEYSGRSVRSLQRLAEAFDVTVTVAFESFSEALDRVEAFGREALEVPSFDRDLKLWIGAAVVEPAKSLTEAIADSYWAASMENAVEGSEAAGAEFRAWLGTLVPNWPATSLAAERTLEDKRREVSDDKAALAA